ncbi:MAG: sigma-70 family RNA polymerase sigma factor [Clostridia bacterium]|nr:sigma-70 family RNA polymerase sigma factor [Clostridia bacterium]
MNDRQIVEMYWNRDEKAISETTEKYGAYCYTIAFGILHNEEDTKESVNDTYMDAWNSMPPNKPKILKTFLGKITRRISIDRWRKKTAQKRGGGELPEVLEELSECITESGNPVNEMEKKLLNETINLFVKELKNTEQKVFLCRYWYADSVESIAKQFGFTQSKVKSMLMRTRIKLKERLIKEDLI